MSEEPEDDFSADAAEYVLRLMPPEEARVFASRLPGDAQLRAEVAFWESQFAEMAVEELGEVVPRAEIADRVADSIGGAQPVPFDRAAPKPSTPGGATWWRGVSAIAAALVLGLSVQLYRVTRPAEVPVVVAENETPAEPERIAEDPILVSILGGDNLMVHLAHDPDLAGARVIQLAAPDFGDQVMELWAVPPGGLPVSLGVLGGENRAVIDLPPELVENFGDLTFAVSLEPAGGSPTGQPTGPLLSTGGVTEF